MQVAHNAERRLLLGVVDHDCVLRGYGVDNAIRQCENRGDGCTCVVLFVGVARVRALWLVPVSVSFVDDRLGKAKGLFARGSVQGHVLRRLGRLAQGIEDRGAFDCYGGLLVAWEMRNRRLAEAGSGVDVDGVDHFVRGLGWVCRGDVHCLVLACWGEQQAAIRGK